MHVSWHATAGVHSSVIAEGSQGKVAQEQALDFGSSS